MHEGQKGDALRAAMAEEIRALENFEAESIKQRLCDLVSKGKEWLRQIAYWMQEA